MIGNVGGDNKVDYTVIGDVVNVASRVEQHTKKAQHPILATRDTYERIESFVEIDPGQIEDAPIVTGEVAYSVPVVAIVGVHGTAPESTLPGANRRDQ